MELFYRKYGEGVPLVIVHGLYGSSDNWVSIAKVLAADFEVFLIDQRNHGRSPHSTEHNYKLMVQDLYQFLENKGIEKAILIGHSMGGKTVMHFAKEFPEKVEALIVLDIAPKSYVELSKKASIHHYLILNAMRSIDFSQIKSRKEIDNQLAENIEDERIRMFLLKNIHRDKNNNFSWSLNVEALYQNIDEIMNGELLPSEDAITGFPILFVRGADSNYILNEDFEKIHTIFPYAEIKTIKNAGHWLHAEQPEELIRIIKEFLS